MIIFDGRKFAQNIEQNLPRKNLKLVAVMLGRDKASQIYLNLKQKAAERINLNFEIRQFDDLELAKKAVIGANQDLEVNGVMVQLPAPPELVELIDYKKDVDGLKAESNFLPATVRAVASILEYAIGETKQTPKSISVVGAKGNVGKRLVSELKKKNFEIREFDQGDQLDLHTDVVISATGQEGLIKGEMVKDGFILIDVGAPSPEFTKEAQEKAIFATPVPGGVGPVTVACLFANLIEANN